MELELDNIYKKLLESIKLLAADFNTQKSSLPDFVDLTDELALIFDDLFVFVVQLKNENYLNQFLFNKIVELNNYLDMMSDNEKLWDLGSLEKSAEWNNVRKISNEILELLNEKKAKPDLFWLDFISSAPPIPKTLQ